MKEYICSKCGKRLSSDEIGFFDEENSKVYCSSCAIKIAEEKIPQEEGTISYGRKKPAKLIVFLIFGLVVIVFESFLLKSPKKEPIKNFKKVEIEKGKGKTITQVFQVNELIMMYNRKHEKFPENLLSLYPEFLEDYEIDEDIVYRKSHEWGYLLYRTDSLGNILEPVLSPKGPLPSRMATEAVFSGG
jgi:DNA-directed RNA polymerase subunit RPC12/RpoP